MNIIKKLFRSQPTKNTASIAKERLKIIVAHERGYNSINFNFLPKLQNELIAVISKYVPIDKEQVKVDLGQDGNNAILELNITLPDPSIADRIV